MDKITIIKWNKQLGPQPIIQYPPEKEFLPKEVFLKIWAKFELQKEKSLIVLTSEEDKRNYLSVAQYYESDLYFFTLEIEEIRQNEIIEDYFEILASISKNVIELIHTDQFMRALSEGYKQIKSFVKLDREENILSLFKDKIKQKILTILERGVLDKTALTKTLREDYGFSTVNIDLLLTPFLKEGLILKTDVPGINECLFLIKDIICLRIPPKIPTLENGNNNIEISTKFSEKLKDFFTNFDCIPEIKDLSLLSVFFDEKSFKLIRILRKKSITVMKSLAILDSKQETFEELIKKKIIYERKGRVYLFSDIRFVTFIPLFILKDLKTRFENFEISSDQYLNHINFLFNELKTTNEQTYSII